MKFSKDSEFFLKFLIDKFNIFIKKKSSSQQKEVDKFYQKIFDDINVADFHIKKRNIKEKFLTKENLKSSDMISSTYVPKKIREYIKNNEGHVIQYNMDVNDHNVEINFILFEDEDISKYFKYVTFMFTWLKIAFKYSSPSCSKEIRIFLYMTPFKKKLPKNSIDILSPIHCNTAVTTGCLEKTEIILFRREEWFKVFIHETFHSLGLDFANYSTVKFKKEINKIYPLKNLEITETYAEFWGTIFNCAFCSYSLLEKKTDFETFLLYNRFCIQFEQIFSIFQIIKILRFMGMDYQSLYEKDSISSSIRNYLYKEKTNVFAYYILKALFLFHHADFLKWCFTNNENFFKFERTPQNLMSLVDFIKEKHNSEDFIQKQKQMLKYFKQLILKDDEETEKILKTMRMTVCELVFKSSV